MLAVVELPMSLSSFSWNSERMGIGEGAVKISGVVPVSFFWANCLHVVSKSLDVVVGCGGVR